MLTLFHNLLGLAIGPFVGGLISDAWGLSNALAVIPCVGLVSAVCFWKASRTYETDMAVVAAQVKAEQVQSVTSAQGGEMPLAPSYS